MTDETLMAAEVAEIPVASARFLAGSRDAVAEAAAAMRAADPRLVVTVARGSSDHAATYLKYVVELAAGVPVVLTDIPSYGPIPAEAAPRVRPGDAAAIAEEVSKLLDDPALWAGRRRRGLDAAAAFSLDRALDALEDALERIVRR